MRPVSSYLFTGPTGTGKSLHLRVAANMTVAAAMLNAYARYLTGEEMYAEVCFDVLDARMAPVNY